MSPGHLLWVLFGPSTWGAGGNMVAWVICGCLGFGWLHGKEKARHLLKMQQAEEHHAEIMAALNAQAEAEPELNPFDLSGLPDYVAGSNYWFEHRRGPDVSSP